MPAFAGGRHDLTLLQRGRIAAFERERLARRP
jgi:hypothetical protein